VGWPDRWVAVPFDDSKTEAADLRRIVESTRGDPFGLLASLVGLTPAPNQEAAHLCATAWVLDPKRQHTLLCRHRVLGWSVPGGHLEPGEEPAAGALRELLEETGLAGRLLVPDPCFVHTSALGGDRPHRHWNLAYAVQADMDAPIRVERDEVAWFALDSLPPDAVADLAPGLSAVSAMVGDFH
jgi:ADP-ribose pyrophosphatase YjhB (NUDIX family)